jgi:hypothetical protein
VGIIMYLTSTGTDTAPAKEETDDDPTQKTGNTAAVVTEAGTDHVTGTGPGAGTLGIASDRGTEIGRGIVTTGRTAA